MDYSVGQVAKILEISERAVLYKIEAGELKGRKNGRRWVVSLPKDAVQRQPQPQESMAPSARHALERPQPQDKDTRANTVKGRRGKGGEPYDFRKLISYQQLRKWYDHTELQKLDKHREHLNRCLERIAVGFYQWDIDTKIRMYNDARNLVGTYLNYVVLHQLEDKNLQDNLFNGLHHDVMGSIIALTKSLERKRRKAREETC